MLSDEPNIQVVAEAKDGYEATQLAHRVQWDMAILDYSMPGSSGLEVLGVMKRDFPNRPVLILSMYAEGLHAQRMLRAGASGYITKECATEELVTAIKKVATGGRYVSASLVEKLAFGLALAPDSDKPPHEALSDREYRVMWLLATGKSLKQIGRDLSLSPNTISTYRTRTLRKLGLGSNAELVLYALKHQLIQ
jgi:DNA-binding NarL/FixJ family response regulator